MSKMVDLEKLSSLQEELKILSGRKMSEETELEKIRNECISLKRETDKEIAQAKQKFEQEIQEKRVEIDKLEKSLNKRQEEIASRERESEAVEQEHEQLQKEKKDLQQEKKDLEAAKASCAEREHKADLLIEQYEEKLKELSKK